MFAILRPSLLLISCAAACSLDGGPAAEGGANDAGAVSADAPAATGAGAAGHAEATAPRGDRNDGDRITTAMNEPDSPRDAAANSPEAEGRSDAGDDQAGADQAGSIYAGTIDSLAGETIDLSEFQGKVTLFVNVASRCGYTPQYAGLQQLHEELGGDEFQIVGVPSNDFGAQEPGDATQIRDFCDSEFGVTFQLTEKIATKGDGVAPLYGKLAALTGDSPNWNFCKYVVSKDGTSAKFFKSAVKPDSKELRDAIQAFLD